MEKRKSKWKADTWKKKEVKGKINSKIRLLNELEKWNNVKKWRLKNRKYKQIVRKKE